MHETQAGLLGTINQTIRKENNKDRLIASTMIRIISKHISCDLTDLRLI